MKFDRYFLYKADTIKDGNNIFNIKEIKDELIIDKNQNIYAIESTIKFSSKLKDNIVFDTGIYKVTFFCKTTDNKRFEKMREVIFK